MLIIGTQLIPSSALAITDLSPAIKPNLLLASEHQQHREPNHSVPGILLGKHIIHVRTPLSNKCEGTWVKYIVPNRVIRTKCRY
ncbi:hypothetical protein yrohd0001_14430 [Yersinia rohdei ATCC 43380]|nr:hypothetical protein yrohd0001_14430 [Yersinia rohdei ATCC 43380]